MDRYLVIYYNGDAQRAAVMSAPDIQHVIGRVEQYEENTGETFLLNGIVQIPEGQELTFRIDDDDEKTTRSLPEWSWV